MNLQKRTLERYRQLFPLETLREISARTGLNITRVFRLYNGKTMKVGELEAFENAITKRLAENPSYARLTDAVDQASTILTNDELGKIAEFIERKVVLKTYGRLYVRHHYQNAVIA